VKLDFDIDIDMQDRSQLLAIVPHVAASLEAKGAEIPSHYTGVYFQSIPIWPLEQTAVYDYKQAQTLGYFKVDLLNNGVYQDIKSEQHLKNLMNQPPLWQLFQEPDIAQQLAQVGEHQYLLKKYPPNSIEDLAVILALIRPGKKHLVGLPWEEIKQQVWVREDSESYVFKRSHAIAFSASIVVQLNLLVEQLLGGVSN
jgi:hypothetical protein